MERLPTLIFQCIFLHSKKMCSVVESSRKHYRVSRSFLNYEYTECRPAHLTGLTGNISNTRKSVLSGYPNTEKCVEKRGLGRFLSTSRCLDILMKHSSECLILHLKQISILRENLDEIWLNFMQVFHHISKLRLGVDFLCF